MKVEMALNKETKEFYLIDFVSIKENKFLKIYKNKTYANFYFFSKTFLKLGNKMWVRVRLSGK